MTTESTAALAAEFTLACPEADVPHGGAVITKTVNGKSVALARRSDTDDTVVAFDSRCPHYQAPLRFGRVVEGEIICPWHLFRFDTTTGAALACDKSIMHLQTYAVRVADGNVYVGAAD